jgi:hypothetical protein
VLTRLVRVFYANLEVVQDDDNGWVFQSIVDGHTITIDPQIISQFIGVLVLQIFGSPYNEVVLPHSLDDIRDFFHAVPQGKERTTTIRIGALSAPHRMLAKIVQHNLWLVVRRSDLILKRLSLYMPSVFACLFSCASIFWGSSWRLVMRAIPVSFLAACLLTHISLQSGIGVIGEPNQDPNSKQTLMKSNAQLRRDDLDDVPQPPPIHVAVLDMVSSSHNAPPPPQQDAGYAQILEALAALQSSMSSMQQEIHSINLCVE